MRQIFLDTETTGLDPNQGHRIIEIAAIEMLNRQQTNNRFHTYINPERDIDPAAQEVHGISLDFLKDKPLFNDISDSFLSFIEGAELIIHNAPFDIGFLNMELGKIEKKKVEEYSFKITDSLKLAKENRPGQRNNLDALCRAYGINNSQRSLHGALLDAELLGEVFLAMTRGQEAFSINFTNENTEVKLGPVDQEKLNIVKPSAEEITLHDNYKLKIKSANNW
ncbi:MAG: DNA polymerase III subunit epsilon [Methylophilaceae bacterium]|jgi:DNA polymerase III subunit epsilon|nr:DNA polymerase III subunit epsilon [Methylophilaceae bacterium]